MTHNKVNSLFLLVIIVLVWTPSTCVARRTSTRTRRRLENTLKNRTCARDAASEVLLQAESDILPEVLQRYADDISVCAIRFLQNLNCASVQKDINKYHSKLSASQMNLQTDMTDRIMKEGNDPSAVITAEECCRDTSAIRDLAVISIKSIEMSWAPNTDVTYDFDAVMTKVEFGVFDNTKTLFANTLKTIGGKYIRELGNELDSVCYSATN
eukprot:CAMPEP_0113562206 /NCGR_PEP_ID=MMETSP0015_2-20120614/20400_1 /TAXON_ID=2838 /ORGANISM="Odontella" /LENGTH=211 /DNA_ID=CAMNT_0000464081 /DNA_START=172 /DNA_END=807 /DNA_ORIENTATION=- /assembly_acc=CAM_ASM_000160